MSPAPETSETTATPPQPNTPVNEYIRSGAEFTRDAAIRLERIHGQDVINRSAWRNNTVRLTYQISEGEPLYKSVLNVTQAVSATVLARTTTDRENAMMKGREGFIHRPDTVLVRILDPDGQYLGRFRINPDTTWKYRFNEFDANVFARNVVNTLELEREWERGSHSPGWYLNRSELHDWVRGYKHILRNMTDPSKTVYKKEFPLENLTIYPDEMRVHHEVIWVKDEMGQGSVSGIADMDTAYWMATNKSWAKAPERLSSYFHRPGIEDVRHRMDVESVYWIITRPKNNTNLNAYLQMDEVQVVNDE